jgi:hypothetical protein
MRACCSIASAFVLLSATSLWGATADWGFEFDHAPALDGAGYTVEPINNIRSPGNMAYLVGQTYPIPGFPSQTGHGRNNGDGTFSYGPDDDFNTAASMGLIQATSATRPVASPLVRQLSFTVEARFKVENVEFFPGFPARYFRFHNKAFQSAIFELGYGSVNGDEHTLFMSSPMASPVYNFSDGEIPLVVNSFVTLRAVATGLGANFGRVESFIKLSDTGDWLVGPSIESSFSKTEDESTLVAVCEDGCNFGDGQVTIDYIRGVNKSLALTESLDAAGGEPIAGDFNGDGSVNAADFAVWQSGFGGALKGGDLLAWQRNFGTTAAAVSAASVPEASACGLALCGLAALAARRRTQSTVC